jgi:hypothetical protein
VCWAERKHGLGKARLASQFLSLHVHLATKSMVEDGGSIMV